MKLWQKIPLIWVCLIGIAAGFFSFFPHEEVNWLGQAVNSLLVLVGLVSFVIFLREPNRKNKPFFLHFAIFFLFSLANFVYPFVGHGILNSNPFSGLFFYQYLGCGLTVITLAFSVLYAVVDTLFREISTVRKYVIAISIVGSLTLYYYHPFITDAKYSYHTDEIVDFKLVDKAVSNARAAGNENPIASEISKSVRLNAWKDGKAIGSLFESENERRISYILPYTQGRNFVILLMKPIHLNVIYMHVFCILFVFLFFGYQYKKDPPQSAYIEKILFLFLPYCSLEILHYYAYVTATELSSYVELYEIAQYLTIINLLLLLIFFSLRLSFITSIKGEFYERELVLDSEHISRWRDGIDNLVVRHFLNPETIHGRLFAPRQAKPRA